MQIDFGVKNISVFSAAIPLDCELEADFSSWLPDNLKNASLVRKQEYMAGRYCANRAAKSLGLELTRLPSASTREPVWPAGMKGSISHSKKMAISCIVKENDFYSIGIDAEEIISSQVNIESVVAIPKELELIQENYKLGLTVLFSGKEALYKALFPIARSFIEFKEVQLTSIDYKEEKFSLELSSLNPNVMKLNGKYDGTFKIQNDTVITLISLRNNVREQC